MKFIEATVVNVNHGLCDVYVGRPSIFGNPYQVGRDGSREEVIAKYGQWFIQRLKDPKFRLAVLELRGKRLGCHCSPQRCHGQVIAEYLNSLEVETRVVG